MASNQKNVLTGFTYNVGDWQIGPNALWQKPNVGPIPAAPADQDFRHHDGHADENDAGQVDKHERTAAVFASHVREFPDVPETDRRTGCGQDENHPRRPLAVN